MDALSLRKPWRLQLDSARWQQVRKPSRWVARRFRLGAAIQPPRCGRLKFLFSLRQFDGENAVGLLLAVRFQFLTQIFIAGSDDRRRKERGIFRSRIADGKSADGNSARHLRGGQKRIEALKLGLHWNAEHGKHRVCGDHTGQMRSAASTGNDHSESAL